MRLISEWERPGGTLAYTARPASVAVPLPAVIVIQEIWGVDDHIRDLVERFASAGYYALAPDLYAPDGQRPAPLSEERIALAKRAFDTMPPEVWRDPEARARALAGFDPAAADGVADTIARVFDPNRPMQQWTDTLSQVAAAVRTAPVCSGGVASTGYCMGGHLSARLAGADAELAAAAIYYGVSPDPAAMASLRCPLIGFYGADDVRVTSGVPAFEQTLRAAGHEIETHVYTDTPHAFFNDTRASYRVTAARDAWARTLALFARTTAPAGT